MQEEILASATSELPGIDRRRVEEWLAECVEGLELPLEFGLIGAGGSNLTYRMVDSGGRRFILRRPPMGKLLPTAHDVAREHRIMAALQASSVPVPEMLALCEDESVTGTAFYVMDYVEGVILRDEAAGVAIGAESARRASASFVESLAALHAVEPAAVGLDGLSRPQGYVARQLRRWFGQYEQTAGGNPNPLIVDLHARLSANVPHERPALAGRLTHGDYHIDNVVYDDALGVRSVLDWELCTLGDPLADVAWALMFWTTSSDEMAMMQSPPTLAPGFYTRAEFVDHYAASSGLDLADLSYFLSFSHWRFACLVQGAVYRAAAGQGGGLQTAVGSRAEDAAARVRRLAELAAAFAVEAGI